MRLALTTAVVLSIGAATARAAAPPPSLEWSLSPAGDATAQQAYGPVVLGGSLSQTFWLRNAGGRATAALTVVLGGAGFTKTADSCSATSLGPRKVCSVTVRYSPTAAGAADNGMLTASGRRTGVDASLALAGSGPASSPAVVAAGAYHACATSRGALECWGRNTDGQLGNGGNVSSNLPAGVSGLPGVTAVAGGYGHTCAVTSAGGVKCWGLDFQGQLGDGTTTDSTAPVAVVGLSGGVTAIAAGDGHTCALTSGGAVRCWGWNTYGQLGDGSRTDSSVPVDVVGLSSGVTAIAAGDDHTCALTSIGAVKCWGLNYRGQLGNGSDTSSSVPVDVSGLAGGVTALAAAGAHTCARTAGGSVVCWGANDGGELGDGTTVDRRTPVEVQGLSGATALAAGGHHTCALAGGGVECWGLNAEGQLGDGDTTSTTAPVAVTGLPAGVTALAAGAYHTCAAAGAATFCWGWNYYGQLGDGADADSNVPVVVQL